MSLRSLLASEGLAMTYKVMFTYPTQIDGEEADHKWVQSLDPSRGMFGTKMDLKPGTLAALKRALTSKGKGSMVFENVPLDAVQDLQAGANWYGNDKDFTYQAQG